jgi:glycosyltransferase involved in cell wall biosynthesis
MNVDWDWAKQRPHFLAQHLSKSHDVVILYPYSWRRNRLAKNHRNGVELYPFVRLPFGGKFAVIGKLNVFLFRILSALFLKWHRPDIVWISSPELFDYLPKYLSAKLIYDCMDDILAFPRNASRRLTLSANEHDLINSCSHVFCSSKNLLDKLIIRAGYPDKFSVIYNAYEPSAFSGLIENVAPERAAGKYVLGYVGTISSWLDFDALVEIVNVFPSLEIHLIGPIENLGAVLPNHERIKYLGVVQHGDIQRYVSGFDALMMPFQVTELIQSVDPIKLYEYIYFNKPIVSVSYPEIERFSNFVDFYTQHCELISIINRYLADNFRKKYSDSERQQFISSNIWSERVLQIQKILMTMK